MTYKIITLAIDALKRISNDSDANIEYQRSLSAAISALTEVKKFL
ncbi:MAG: hypothetical protein ACR2NF_10935 [Pirellulales bacterium]